MLELGRGLEQGILNRDVSRLKEAGLGYLAKPSSVPVAIGVPLTAAAAGINYVDASQGDISAEEAASLLNTSRAYAAGAGVLSGLAAPAAAQLLLRDENLTAEAAVDRLHNELKGLGFSKQEVEDGWNAYVEEAANATEDAIAPDKAGSGKTKRQRMERAYELTSKEIPAAERRLAGIRNQRRSMGAGMTAAGLGLAGLALAFNDRSPMETTPAPMGPPIPSPPLPNSGPYDADNVPLYVAPSSWSSYYPGRELGE